MDYRTDSGSSYTELAEKWSVDQEFSITTSPLVLNDRIYVSTRGRLKSIGIGSDSYPETVFETGITATPAIAGDTIVLPTFEGNGMLYAVGSDGDIDWQCDLPGGRPFAPILSDDDLFIKSRSAVTALSYQQQTVEWSVDTPRYPATSGGRWADLSPAVTEDHVYVPRKDGLQCLERATGDDIWHERTDPVATTPAVADGQVYAPTIGDGVVAMDADTGTIEWTTEEFECWTTPVVDDGVVYTPARFDLVALDADSGVEQWRYTDPGLGGRSYTNLTLIDDLLVAGSTGYAVVTVSTDGTVRAIADGSSTEFSHVIEDGTVYVATRDGLSAYSLESE
ncbi:outer membrane protein assembly factor BamB family protein [Natronobacterium haloterrestre]|nr:PQQ-binding-like beta-propeller repeat protein [Halobiforma haloterrestris]